MRIPRRWVEAYSRSLNRLSERGRAELEDRLAQVDWSQDVAKVREQVMAIMQACCGASSDVAARLSAEFYDGLRAEFGIGDGFSAEVDGGYEPGATEGAVRAFAQDLVDGRPVETFVGKCSDRLDREVRLSANRCVERNARRDPKSPRWARVPTGPETCGFCIMLASRGFVYHSEELASHAHANCDCRVVPSWDKAKAEVEGYDPDEYLAKWQESVQLDEYLKSEDGKAYAKAHGMSAREIRDAFARAKGGAISAKGSVESFIDSLAGRKAEWEPDALHPASVAGVARSKESMSFAQADGLRANPGYGEDSKRYFNCQSCVVANEARRRGYDVAAMPFSKTNAAMNALAAEPYIAFQNSSTGELPRPIRYKGDGNPTLARFHAMVESTVHDGERYALRFTTRGAADNEGHVVCLDRNDRGELRVLDPQSGTVYVGRAVREYLKRVQYTQRSYGLTTPCDNYIFRMDDAELNPRVVDQVLEAMHER